MDTILYFPHSVSKIASLNTGSLTECAILSSYFHPHIVRFHDVVIDNHRMIISIERGITTLSQYMDNDGHWSLVAIKQIGGAINYLYNQGWFHGDIKPDNVIITSIEPLHLKLIDFNHSNPTSKPSEKSTLYYRPIEVLINALHLGGVTSTKYLHDSHPYYQQYCDSWSFGLTCLCIVCRKPDMADFFGKYRNMTDIINEWISVYYKDGKKFFHSRVVNARDNHIVDSVFEHLLPKNIFYRSIGLKDFLKHNNIYQPYSNININIERPENSSGSFYLRCRDPDYSKDHLKGYIAYCHRLNTSLMTVAVGIDYLIRYPSNICYSLSTDVLLLACIFHTIIDQMDFEYIVATCSFDLSFPLHFDMLVNCIETYIDTFNIIPIPPLIESELCHIIEPIFVGPIITLRKPICDMTLRHHREVYKVLGRYSTNFHP